MSSSAGRYLRDILYEANLRGGCAFGLALLKQPEIDLRSKEIIEEFVDQTRQELEQLGAKHNDIKTELQHQVTTMLNTDLDTHSLEQ